MIHVRGIEPRDESGAGTQTIGRGVSEKTNKANRGKKSDGKYETRQKSKIKPKLNAR